MMQSTPQARLYICQKVDGDPTLWGVEDWRIIPHAEPFILASGAGAATLQTQVRVVWTETALHVSFWCEDPEPWATMRRRDDSLYEEEVVEVFLAPYSDRTTYFEFEINPLGTLFDALIHLPRQGSIEVHREWDCMGLLGSARLEPGGWQASLCIPFAGLGVHPSAGETCAVNFYRIERRPRNEYSSWSPLYTDPPAYHTPERFGTIRFVSNQSGVANLGTALPLVPSAPGKPDRRRLFSQGGIVHDPVGLARSEPQGEDRSDDDAQGRPRARN